MDATQFQQVAKALAEPRRLEILEAIAARNELSCREIVEQFLGSPATVSHHNKGIS
jgi:ArsR family transcriptional regulator